MEQKTARVAVKSGAAFSTGRKKPYTNPTLSTYGRVADLTRSGAPSISEGHGTKKAGK